MIYQIFLIAHITAGTISLLTGPLAIAATKGGQMHRRSGLTFFYAMLVVAVTAVVMGLLHDNPFLLAVGVFSAYMDITGYRVLYQKQRGQIHKTTRFDHLVSLVMLLASAYFLLFGIRLLFLKDLFGLVFITFSYGSLRMLRQDLKLFQHQDVAKNTWLVLHLTRMLGTCIATYTALLVVNSSFHFSLVSWFLPTLIGLPILIYWLRKVKTKPSKPVMEIIH